VFLLKYLWRIDLGAALLQHA